MRYIHIIVLTLFTFLAQAQTDSVRTEYKTEDEKISSAEVKRFIRYITRANVEEKTLVKVGIWPATERNTNYESRLFRVGANVEVAIEQKLSPSFSILAGLDGDWRYSKYRNTRSLYPVGTVVSEVFRYQVERLSAFNVNWKAGLRYYHSMNRSIKLGRSANNFSGNYLTIQISKPLRTYFNNQYFDVNTQSVLVNKNSDRLYGNISSKALLAYGIQRRLGKLSYFDINVGPEVLYPAFYAFDNRRAVISFQLNALIGFGW